MEIDLKKLKSIEEVLKKHSLFLALPIKNLAKKKRFYVFLCQDKTGKKFVIKYVREIDNAENDFLKKFKNEVLFSYFVKKNLPEIRKHIPELLAFDFSEIWQISEFIQGVKLTNKNDPFSFKPRILGHLDLKGVVSFFGELNNFNWPKLKKEAPTIPIYDKKKHQEYFSKMEPAKRVINNLKNQKYGFLSKKEKESLYRFYISPDREYFSYLGLVHSDISPENTFIVGDNFCFIDWENVGIGPKLIDFVSFWARSFLNKKFQERLFYEKLKKETDKKLFLRLFNKTFLLSSLGILDFYRKNLENRNISRKSYKQAEMFVISVLKVSLNYI